MVNVMLNGGEGANETVSESSHLLAFIKPSAVGDLLPNSHWSVDVQKQCNGSHTNLSTLGNVVSQ